MPTNRMIRHELHFQNAAIAQAYKPNFVKCGLPQVQVKRNVLSFQVREDALPVNFFEKIATYRGYLGKMSIIAE